MKRTVLIADDDFMNRDILRDDLESEFDIMEAVDGVDALEKIHHHGSEISVVLLDIVMPGKTGLEVMKELYEEHISQTIPVLIITGEQSAELKRHCYQYGVADFINKPFDGQLVLQRTKNIAELYAYKNGLESKVFEQNQQLEKQNEELRAKQKKLEEINDRIIEIIGSLVEARNLESGQHVRRVKTFTRMLAEELARTCPEYGLTKEDVATITSAATLHDVGKIMISDSVLLKPGRLTKEEFDCMKTHTTQGRDLLRGISDVWDDHYEQVATDIACYHHERFDGRGYPEGLLGDEIPIAAQIVSIADVYDALVYERVYKKAFPLDVAYNMIRGGECGNFNPKLLECFAACRPQFEAFVKTEQ